MGVNIKYMAFIPEPENVPITLALSMPYREWKILRDSLPSNYPAWKLTDIIDELLAGISAKIEAKTGGEH